MGKGGGHGYLVHFIRLTQPKYKTRQTRKFEKENYTANSDIINVRYESQSSGPTNKLERGVIYKGLFNMS